MMKVFFQTLGGNLRLLKLRYYFSLYNLFFIGLTFWMYFLMDGSHPRQPSIIYGVMIIILNGLLFPWVKAYGAHVGLKKGHKNLFARNYLDNIRMAIKAGNDAYDNTEVDHEATITRLPFSQFLSSGPEYEVRNRTSNKSKKSNRREAYMVCLVLRPYLDLAIMAFVWMFSLFIGWFAMHLLIAEWKKEQAASTNVR